jgi:flagellar hook-basal body complex protein FliE
MRIDPIVPDQTPLLAPTGPGRTRETAPGLFGQLVDAAGAALGAADAAETAFVHGTGGLTEMVVGRARADVSLAIAATGAQRAVQALNTLLGMQI